MLKRSIAVIVTTSTALSLGVAPAYAANTVEFSVSNFTDLHGHFVEDAKRGNIGLAKFAALVDKANAGQEYALVSSGDSIGGSAFVSAIAEDQPTMDMLNELGVDVSAIGNHELDKGYADLTGRVQDNSDFPLLGANVYKDGQRALPASHIEELSGVKVAFVGTVTAVTPDIVAKDGIAGLEFRDPVAETNAEAKALKESSAADVVIALFHDDAETYKADFAPEVDVVFGGHTHQRTMGEVAREGGLPLHYAQSHEFSKVLTDYDFTFNLDTRELVSVEGAQYGYEEAKDLVPNVNIAAMVTAAEDKAAELGAQVVGTIDAPLLKPTVNGAESTFSNFIAEAGRWAVSEKIGTDIDLGIMNEGGVRTEFEAGDVTFEDTRTAQPFGSDMQYGTLTGQNILDILELQWREGAERPWILGFSKGFTFTYDPAAPAGDRITSATINGKALDPAATYTVAASSFLFGGGDGFTPMTEATNLTSIGMLDVEALTNYLASDAAVVPTTQAGVGVGLPEKITAGETVSIDLTSLNYSGAGDAKAAKVTVALGSASATADIANEETDALRGNLGTATVELEVPSDVSGEQELTITTDAGTKVTLPVTVEADAAPTTTAQPGSSFGKASLIGAGIFAALVAIVTTLQIVLPREAFDKFYALFRR